LAVDTVNRSESLQAVAEPSELGFDPERLTRLDRHFARYVDDGRLPGWLLLVSRAGRVAHLSVRGLRDREAGLPVEVDTIFRIYSMTKPVTSVAAMMLFEEGAFELTTPVSRFLPAYGDARVYVRGSAEKPLTSPVREPVRIWHLLTHTAGLSYGFHHAHAVDEAYRTAGYEQTTPAGTSLAEATEKWATLPLLFEPGTEWNYSHATDVLGRVLEVASGQSLDRLFQERVFEPLGMRDTGFSVRERNVERLAALYVMAPGQEQAVRNDAVGGLAVRPPDLLSGGGGLLSTAADYHRFAVMLLQEGELDGRRLLAPRTVRYMRQNHLPGGGDLETVGRPLFAETTYAGVGFGLGFSVVVDPVALKGMANRGEFGWGGAASTVFWVDPVDKVVVIFMTQLVPSSTFPVRSELRQLVHQALVDRPA
jgi:CubicO group peptidase (beta-lactamase class C family)